MSCYLCHLNTVRPYIQKDGFTYLKCRHCHFVYLDPFPSNVNNFYNLDYFQSEHHRGVSAYVNYEKDKRVMNRFFGRQIERIQTICNHQAIALLDAGAATGYFLHLASEFGVAEGEGIEISKEIVDEAGRQGRNVMFGQLGSLPSEFLAARRGRFDAITLWDVIEHLCDLERSFDEIDTLLKPTGLVLLTTPNVGSWWARLFGKHWHSFVPPEHVLFFEPNTIRYYLSRRGYEVLSVEVIHKQFTLQYIFNTMYRWQHWLLWQYFSDWLARHPRIGLFTLTLPIGDNMLVIARKKV